MIPMIWAEQATQSEATGDGRYGNRHDVDLEVRWKLILHRKVVDAGVGRILALSSRGIVFEAGRTLPIGLDMEVSVSWPVCRDVAPLQVVVLGRIVLSDGWRVALRMIRHEFPATARFPEYRQAQATEMRAPSPLLASVNRMARVVKPESNRTDPPIALHEYLETC
jgi:hypothetical protein